MKTKLLFSLSVLGALTFGSAQGIKIGDNPGILDPASLLELESSSLVFVPTRVTTAQMNAITPLDGALVYNTTEQSLFYYESGVWSRVGGIDDSGNNLFIGESSGDSNTSGTNNSAYGFRTLRSNTAGSRNTVSGSNALRDNVSGSNNSAFGFNALRAADATNNSAFGLNSLVFNQSGNNNSAFGINTLRELTNGANNSALGLNALRETNGLRNTAMGSDAMARLTTGNNNTGIGNNAGSLLEDGSSLTSIDNSVFIGNGTRGQANGQDNQIVIGHNAVGNGSNTVTIGNSSITDNFFNGNVDITGEFRVNGEAISGGGPITGLTNPLVEDLDAAGFDILNLNKLDINNGSRSVYIGENAGLIDSTASAVVGIGFLALSNYSGGGSTVAVGDGALLSLTTGNTNTGIGNQSMQNLESGNDNSALGHKTMERNVSGSQNTSIGSKSLRHIASGNNNTALGYQAGRFVQGGAQNLGMENGVIIGTNAYPLASGGTNEIVIGTSAIGNGSNTVTLGNDNITDVYFGNGYKFSGAAAPTSASAPGEEGEIRIDSSFIYVCVAPNTWVRAALSSW